ncbi:hypothetical protein acsn021_18450 [Anaerocolumna cellulosilytica]|uniref:Uncharacterized protein n=1 Tax=Anaerocolumna cellulosilytica TaxID=433286 RepID=A0A6S6QX27_9FIRM|nr:SWIM zinc finger family protein [Anaerocolumna cellulosilytica]MBB5194761.1 hypothetical protein [Anaerocolumna cellulosilytica]BCJ94276.1 hypothetical protein acsn021_18450 [Anaerocolumna cellulosilytica]
MSNWQQILQPIDEEYLIGLTNKGIVKRASKDLEQAACTLKEEGDKLVVQVDEALCTLEELIGDSKCSCPSRSICKHIVIAVLYAKDKLQREEKTGREEKTETDNALFPSILEYPLPKLKAVLGDKKYQNFCNRVKQGIYPVIKTGTTVTVEFKDADIKVRLLNPIEHSSCSCHKKDLCQHKAEAILYFQLKEGKVTLPDLEKETLDSRDIDLNGMKQLAGYIQELLTQQIVTGLARSSPSITDTLERTAILCHNGNLAEFERKLRELKEEYEHYFNRSASFCADSLLHKICQLYRMSKRLLLTEDKLEAASLAGEFRVEYLPAGTLTLLGMGQRQFHSKTGYEGETYYFLEETTQEWYTYTNARPVYYDTKNRAGQGEKGRAPWQLLCSLEELSEGRIMLYNGKASLEHRLSATTEAKAEYFGRADIDLKNYKKQYYEDFLKLYEERIKNSWLKEEQGTNENLNQLEQMVLIKPASIKNAVFDAIRQQYSMELYDTANRMILLQIAYSKKENYTIRFLERLARRIEKGVVEVPCFFGILYKEEGKLKLYPIHYFNEPA